MSENNEIPERFHIMRDLFTKFFEQYNEMIAAYTPLQQVELTEHLMRMMQYLEAYAPEKNKEVYKEMAAAETALMKKYGKLLKPYLHQKFHVYFYYDMVLAEKDILTTEQYNNSVPGTQELSVTELEHFAKNCYRSLDTALYFLLKELEPEPSLAGPAAMPDEDGTPLEPTKARQLLAIHYLLAAGFNTEGRTDISVSSMARFAHFITGAPFTNLQNSEIYKKMRKLPNINKGQTFINDLLHIRRFFAELQLDAAVNMIDKEISREKQERKQ
jgi:hypothetical protein